MTKPPTKSVVKAAKHTPTLPQCNTWNSTVSVGIRTKEPKAPRKNGME